MWRSLNRYRELFPQMEVRVSRTLAPSINVTAIRARRRPPRVEVVAPVSDLAIGDREYRDVPVGVRGPGRNDSAFGGVLENDDAGLDVVMDREVVTSVEDDHRAVGAVELGGGLAALDVPWVAGSRDDVVE